MEGNYDVMNGSGVWLIILFVLLFGGTGFGNGNKGYTDATTNEILSGQKFDALSRQINQIGDGLSSSTFALNNSINAVQTNLGAAITTEGRNIQSQLCAINSNIDNKFAALEKSQLEQTIAAQQNQINQLSLAQQMAGVVKYPMQSSYAMLNNPFCGCGCN